VCWASGVGGVPSPDTGGALNAVRVLAGLACTLTISACDQDSGTQISDSSFGAFEVSLAVSRDDAAVAWYDTRDGNAEIYLRLLDVNGQDQSMEYRLTHTIDQRGTAYVVFDAAIDTDVEELFLARLQGSRNSLARITSDDGYRSKYPDLAVGPRSIALTWFDERDGNREVYLYVAPDAEFSTQCELDGRRITHTEGASIGAYVASNAGQFGLAWSDNTDGAYDVYFQSFDALGSPRLAAQRLTTTTHSRIPAIEAWQDRFAVAWNEVARGAAGIYGEDTRSEVMFSLVQ